MSDGEILLATILANPEDDNARLVYADWLQEHGGPRGERRATLIRLMCARPKSRFTYSGGWKNLPAREPWRGTRAALDDFLAEGLPKGFVVRRGFVCEVEPDRDEFLSTAGALFAAHPITRVRLADRSPLRSGDHSWGWYASLSTENGESPPMTPLPHWVGEVLGDLLTKATSEPDLPLVRWYGSEASANAALGRACLAYGHAAAAKLRPRI